MCVRVVNDKAKDIHQTSTGSSAVRKPRAPEQHDPTANHAGCLPSDRGGSRVDKAGWATSGPWTRASLPSRASGALSGVPSITRVTSSIAASSCVATVGRRHACSARCCRGRRRVRPGGWAPTRCRATGLHTERSCRPSLSARTDTRTIVPTSPTSPHGTARDTCAGSTLLVRHNDSCPCTDSSAPSSAVAVTWCERCISGNDEDALFSLGMPSRSPPDANCDHDPEYWRARRTLT